VFEDEEELFGISQVGCQEGMGFNWIGDFPQVQWNSPRQILGFGSMDVLHTGDGGRGFGRLQFLEQDEMNLGI